MTGTKVMKFRDVIINMGVRTILVSLLVFLLAVGATCMGGYRLYRSTKESIHLQSEVNAVESAKKFDSYLLERENAVLLTGEVVDEMLRRGKTTDEILEYLTAESVSIKRRMEKNSTGIYGWINGEYCDGDGWVPDGDYVPTERPWYTETVADDAEITYIRPYLDDQTKTVLTTIARKLSNGVDVIAMDVSLGRIEEITEEVAQQSPDSIGIVLDKNGQVIAHSDESELGKNYLEETDTLGASRPE